MWDKFKSFWHYQTVKEGRSPINGLYKVVIWFNRPRLLIGNMVQSGGAARKIWYKAIHSVKNKQVKVDKVLILGLGCGDCAFEISQHYPKAQITGVEIDPHIVDVAQCYFDLATIKNLSITVADAAKFTAKLARKKKPPKFDLILVDTYLGKTMPRVFRTKKYFKQLAKLLSSNGIVIYNHLFFNHFRQEAEQFIKHMEAEFGKINLLRAEENLLIFGWH